MKILLIYPKNLQYSCFPLGLGYMAASLIEKKHDVRLVDLGNIKKGFVLKEYIKEYKPDLVGISFMTPNYDHVRVLCNYIKKIDLRLPIVVGGPHASSLPKETLKELPIDFVISGEGEKTIVELCEYLSKKRKKESIKGLYYKNKWGIYENSKREPILDLDGLPFPARHLIDINQYKADALFMDASKPMATILTSRGCPNQCIYCDTKKIFGLFFRKRSAENIIKEIKELLRVYNINQFDIIDDTFTVDRDRVIKFCEIIKREKIKIKWICNARVNTLDETMLRAMKSAGCVRIDFGVESGSEAVLKNIKKGITLAQIMGAFELCKKVGVKTMGFFMIGNPGDTKKTVKECIGLIKKLDIDYPSFSMSTPFPGTVLYQWAQQNNYLRTKNWDEYDTTESKYGQLPVMRNDILNYKEILWEYRKARFFVWRWKLRKRFGPFYIFNIKMYPFIIKKIKNMIRK